MEKVGLMSMECLDKGLVIVYVEGRREKYVGKIQISVTCYKAPPADHVNRK